MTAQRHIAIQVNGENREIAAGLTVTTLLEQMRLNPGRVAVEQNRSIVPRDQWAETQIVAGDQFEIVQFVGGG